MTKKQLIKYSIAAVWLSSGLLCKVLNLVPRHEAIVARILGPEHAYFFTKLIGIAEIGMAVWIFIGFKSRLNTFTQIIIIAAMNVLEFFLAPDLLLWGKLNLLYAFLFILLIGYNEFSNKPQFVQQS